MSAQTQKTAQILPFISSTLLPEALQDLKRYARKNRPDLLDDASALKIIGIALARLHDRAQDPLIQDALDSAARNLHMALRLVERPSRNDPRSGK